ncbi:MAG: iron-containing alcohol dehydrogenase, partial [Limnochordia bacterium]|nr:iron-containing alcohol dehydrogenase [Limnochordia bacterium]
TILEGIRRLEDFFHRIGLPTTLAEAGISADRLGEMAEKATAGDTQTLGNFMHLGQRDVLAIYKLTQG